MGNFFFEKTFYPVVYSQNDQRVMGIILRYVCWGTDPPPPRGARRLTAQPANPQGLGQPRGGGVPPTPQPPKRLQTPRGHTLASVGSRGWVCRKCRLAHAPCHTQSWVTATYHECSERWSPNHPSFRGPESDSV